MAREAERGSSPGLNSKVRVHHLFVPRMAATGLVLHSVLRPILGFSVGIGWIIFVVAMNKSLQPEVGFDGSRFAIALGVATVPVVIYASAAFAALRRFITPPLGHTYWRLWRLNNFLRDPRAAVRFPHRALEREMLRARLTAQPSPAAKAALLPGTAVLVGPDFWMEGCEQSFEPIDVTKDGQALAWLQIENWNRRFGSSGIAEPDSSTDDDGGSRLGEAQSAPGGWRSAAGKLAVVWAVCAAAYGLWLGLANVVIPGLSHLARGRFSFQSTLVTALAVAILTLVLWPLIRPNHLVLIPGGLLRVVRWAWQRSAGFQRFNAAESALLVDCRMSGRIDVVSGSAKARFWLSPELVPGFLAGWLSTAVSPTDAQLWAWFGETSASVSASTHDAGRLAARRDSTREAGVAKDGLVQR